MQRKENTEVQLSLSDLNIFARKQDKLYADEKNASEQCGVTWVHWGSLLDVLGTGFVTHVERQWLVTQMQTRNLLAHSATDQG